MWVCGLGTLDTQTMTECSDDPRRGYTFAPDAVIRIPEGLRLTDESGIEIGTVEKAYPTEDGGVMVEVALDDGSKLKGRAQ